MWRPASTPHNLILLITIARTPKAVKLTAIQTRIVRLVVLGCEDHEIAAILCRPVRSIRRQKARTINRIGITDPADLTRWAVGQGISRAGDRLSPTERLALGEM